MAEDNPSPPTRSKRIQFHTTMNSVPFTLYYVGRKEKQKQPSLEICTTCKGQTCGPCTSEANKPSHTALRKVSWLCPSRHVCRASSPRQGVAYSPPNCNMLVLIPYKNKNCMARNDDDRQRVFTCSPPPIDYPGTKREILKHAHTTDYQMSSFPWKTSHIHLIRSPNPHTPRLEKITAEK